MFILYELEFLTVAEVAAAVSCNESTALYRLHAARRKLSSALKRRDLSAAGARARREREGGSMTDPKRWLDAPPETLPQEFAQAATAFLERAPSDAQMTRMLTSLDGAMSPEIDASTVAASGASLATKGGAILVALALGVGALWQWAREDELRAMAPKRGEGHGD